MSASTSTEFYNAIDARIVGLLLVAVVGLLIVVLASSTLFNKFRKSGRWILRAVYYVALGVSIYIAGRSLYAVGYWLGEILNRTDVTPADVGKLVVYVVGLGVLGYIGEYTGKRIAANVAKARNEKAANGDGTST